MGERKRLAESQRELIRLKRLMLRNAVRLVEQRRAELQRTINTAAVELGVDIEKEVWRLTDGDEFFEKEESPSPPSFPSSNQKKKKKKK